MNVSIYNTKDYENISDWTLGQNKPNSNPIKPNFQKAQMNVNSLITKDYRKKDDFAVRKNKPNSNPISVKAKMSANAFSQKDYENETVFRPQKNKPKQTQSQNPIYPQRAKIKHAVATAEAAKLLPWLDCVVCLRVSGSLDFVADRHAIVFLHGGSDNNRIVVGAFLYIIQKILHRPGGTDDIVTNDHGAWF